jgi:hypothetical protein
MAQPLFTEVSAPANPAQIANQPKAPATQPKTPSIPAELQSHYAEISNRDAAVRKRELALTAKQKEIEALAAKYGDLDKIKGNASEVLKRFSLTPDQILLEQLGKKPATPKVEEQIAELKAQIAADKEAREKEGLTAKQAEEQRNIQYFRQNVANEVSQKADKYPLANALGMHGHIADEMGVYFEEYGKAPTVDAIAQAAENFVAEAMKKAGWTPPQTRRAAPGVTPAVGGGKLFSEVEEVRREPKNQDARKPFSLSDRVAEVLGR